MKEINKKYFIDILRTLGFKANYNNIAWYYNINGDVIGGALFCKLKVEYFCLNEDYGLFSSCLYSNVRPKLINLGLPLSV